MHKTHQVLPRLRTSFPGSFSKPHRCPAVVWYVGLAICGLLLVLGLIEFSRYVASHRSSRPHKHGQFFSTSKDFEPLAAAVAALQKKAAEAAGAAVQQKQAQQAASAESIQQLQQGADATGVGPAGMTRTLREDGSWFGSMNFTAAAAATEPGARFFDASNNIKTTAEAMARRPDMHGHMVKTGTTDLRYWMSSSSDVRLDSFLSWRVNRTRRGGAGPATVDSYTCPAADHPPMPFPGCHVFVNHKYKYIYVRSPKAASTSIVNVLGECNNKATRGHNSSTCMVLHFYWNSTELLQENIQQMWKDYFVFGFVRNPWKRAYSLYKYLHSNGCMPNDKLRDPSCHVPWPTFCADPWSAAEELHDRGCIKRSKSYLYFHMEDQYHCMRTADGGWAVDFIGRVDDPNEDWDEVVNTINANRSLDVPEIPVAPLEQKNVRAGNLKDPYDAPGAEQCFDAVSRWYACDVQHYGFANLQGT